MIPISACVKRSPEILDSRQRTWDYTKAAVAGRQTATIPFMKSATALIAFVVVACSALAQTATTSATVPITLDHNRIIVDVYFPVPDGGKTRVRGWVDNGNADLWISGRLAKKLALQPVGSPAETSPEKPRKVQPPRELQIGTMTVQLAGLKEATAVPGTVIGGGTSAEINLPSTVLRNYRSEERRVGKEWKSVGARDQVVKNTKKYE